MWRFFVVGIYVFVSSFLLSIGRIQAQNLFFEDDAPYRLSWQVEVPVASLSLGTTLAYFALNEQVEPFTVAELNALDRTDVWTLDRPTTYLWSPTVARVSDGLLYGSMAAPLALMADANIRKDALPVAILYLETFALTYGLTHLTKVLIQRPRPFLYNNIAPLHEQQETDARYGFFSGHTSVSAAMCFMTAKIYNDYNPGKASVPWVWAAAAAVPAATGVLRQQAGKHFWTDVVVGYAVGAAVGWLVPELHRLNKEKTARQPSVQF